MTYDYYGEDGCCLTCEDAEEGCLCFECKCRKCVWYEYGLESPCTYPREHAVDVPEGWIEVDLNGNGDVMTMKIHPYVEEWIFDNIIEVLKGHGLIYDPDGKIWSKTLRGDEETIRILEALEKEEVRVSRKDERLFNLFRRSTLKMWI